MMKTSSRTEAPGFKRVASLLGREIYVAEGMPECNGKDIRLELSKYNTAELLRLVGRLADDAFFTKGPSELTVDALAYIARAAIEVGSDEREIVPTLDSIRHAALMYHNLRDPGRPGDDGYYIGVLIRMGYSQFVGTPDAGQLISRTWYLFRHLWDSVEKARPFEIDAAIQDLIGVDFEKALAWVLAYWGSSRKGFTSPYNVASQLQFPEEFRLSPDEAKRLFDWMSCTYQDIQQRAANDDDFEKFQLSPFAVSPLVKPDRIPPGADPDVRVAPVPSLILRKITSGVYHALSAAHDQGGKKNLFRSSFGHVFEAYVGELLRASCGNAKIVPEFEYAKGKKSPDWMVLQDDTLVVIEVKQSALSLAVKITGDVDGARSALTKTLTKGVQQLLNFRTHLQDVGIEQFRQVKRVVLMLVTQDDIPSGNFILPPLIAGAEDVQFANIEELEFLQRYCWGKSPFQILNGKMEGKESRKQDLQPFLLGLYGSPLGTHRFLHDIYSNFMKRIGLPD